MFVGVGIGVAAGGGGAMFEPNAALALDFVNGRYRVGAGSGSSPDFAALPGLTVSRAGEGYAETSAGVLVPFAANTARITDKGLLVEESRTNIIPNSTASNGAVLGVIGSGGALPTGWAANGQGTTVTVVATGTEDVPYIDVRFSGSPSSTTEITVDTNSVTAVAVASTAAYSASFYYKLAGGSLTNVGTSAVRMREGDAGGTLIANTGTNVAAPSATRARGVHSLTTTATTVRGLTRFSFGVTNGQAIDVTIRFYAPQLEAGVFPTSYIPTTSASATRGADSVSIAGLSLASQPLTLLAYGVGYSVDAVTRRLLALSDGTASNRYLLSRLADNNLSESAVAGGVGQTTAAGTTVTGAFSVKAAGSIGSGTHKVGVNGVAYGAAAITNPTGPLTRLDIGQAQDGTGQFNGYIPRVAVYPRAFTDAELQAATQ